MAVMHGARFRARSAPAAPSRYRHVLATYLPPLRGRLALLGLLMLVDISLDLIGPRIQKAFIDGALESRPMADLLRLAAAYLALAFVLQGLFVASTWVAADIAQRATNHLREDLLAHVLRLDLRFHDRRTPGELIERIDGDVSTLANFLSRFVLELLGSVLLLGGVLVLLYRIDPRVGLILSAFALVSFVAMRRMTAGAAARWEASREANAQLFGFLEERIAATEDIRASGAAEHTMRGLFTHARVTWKTRLRAALFGSITGSTSIFLMAVGSALALALGIWLYLNDEITLGTVFLIFSYGQLIRGPIDGIARQMEDMQRAGAGITRIGALLAEPAVEAVAGAEGDGGGGGDDDGGGDGDGGGERVAVTQHGRRDHGDRTSRGAVAGSAPDRAPADALPEGPLAVSLVDVGFGYDPEQPVLSNVTIDLPAGSSLGLLGRTGSGKSTIARLLLRLYDPDAGTIHVGARNLRGLAHSALRSRVAMVTQDVQLFETSLRDNLTLFNDRIADERLAAALDALGLSDWLAGLPAGLDTRLQSDGGGLSAGEAQLVALGRVMLRDPGLVLLDEASSRLDPVTERRIERALARLTAGRTVIVIAHRLATVRRVDHVAILASGRVVEQGGRADLEADPTSRFAALLATGLEDVEAAVEVGLDGGVDGGGTDGEGESRTTGEERDSDVEPGSSEADATGRTTGSRGSRGSPGSREPNASGDSDERPSSEPNVDRER